MKEAKGKILLISSVYPGPDIPQNFTPVVHYFAREWVKLGYDVKVIHDTTYFWRPLYWMPGPIRKFVSNRFNVPLPTKRLSKQLAYKWEDVEVVRIPFFKWIPMREFSRKELDRRCQDIIDLLDTAGFKPDIVIGHWVNPQLYVADRLKAHYGCRSALVLHESGATIRRFPDYERLISGVDLWGYRNRRMKESMKTLYGVECDFQCFSGIPARYITDHSERDFSNVSRYVFVGILQPRKYPDLLIQAVSDISGDTPHHIRLIGDGPMRGQLEKLIESLPHPENVDLEGRIPRDEIAHKLDEADVFVMISKNEAFGLVYLEAMARGCIVVASKKEGMDGIIVDGVNGFLCEAGNLEDLKEVLQRIRKLTPAERKSLSDNALQTVKEFTDEKVAIRYLKSVGMAAEK